MQILFFLVQPLSLLICHVGWSAVFNEIKIKKENSPFASTFSDNLNLCNLDMKVWTVSS